MSAGGHSVIQNVKEIQQQYTTKKEMQERYGVRPKQLALYISRRKYLGGTDGKPLAKKQRATNDELEPSISK